MGSEGNEAYKFGLEKQSKIRGYIPKRRAKTYRNLDKLLHREFYGTGCIELRDDREVEQGFTNVGSLLVKSDFGDFDSWRHHREK